jgi:hypothetical protein
MRPRRKDLTAFRPSLIDIRLEDRVVLNGGSGSAAQVASFAAATNSGTQAFWTRRDIYKVYHTQFLNTANGAKQILDSQIDQVYANGKPSANQLAGLQGTVNGLVDASAFQLSSQLALLPAATDKMVAQFQVGMLANNSRSLADRLNGLISSARFKGSAERLKAVINRTITNYTKQADRLLINYLNTTPINRLSVDARTGQRIPVQQFMAQQVVTQFGASLGSLAKAFPTVANGAIVSNGVISTDPAVQQAFATQLQSAINTANFQLASNLAVLKGASQALASQLQQAIFGSGQSGPSTTGTTGTGTTGTGTTGTGTTGTATTGTGTTGTATTGTGTTGTGTTGTGTTGTATIGTGTTGTGTLGTGTTGTTGVGTTDIGTTTALSLINALSSVPITTTSAFFPAVNSAFNSTFQNVSGMLGNSFNLPATGTTTGLPIDIIPSIGGPIFFGFNNGFNNGFGSGFIGFGQSLTQQNNFLSTGFNNGFSALTTAQNQLFGFNPSNFLGFGMTVGVGGTGLGTGTTGLGTGTSGLGSTGTTIGIGAGTTGTTGLGTATGTTGIGGTSTVGGIGGITGIGGRGTVL